MFPDIDFETEKMPKLPITERVKTFEDACRELGGEHPFVMAFDSYLDSVHDAYMQDSDIIAYLELRIICAALNEGWEPQFTEDERCWYPWFWLYTKENINNRDEDGKKDFRLMSTDNYQTGDYPGLVYACADYHISGAAANCCSHLYLKNKTLADYCGKQFVERWADFRLIRRK